MPIKWAQDACGSTTTSVRWSWQWRCSKGARLNSFIGASVENARRRRDVNRVCCSKRVAAVLGRGCWQQFVLAKAP